MAHSKGVLEENLKVWKPTRGCQAPSGKLPPPIGKRAKGKQGGAVESRKSRTPAFPRICCCVTTAMSNVCPHSVPIAQPFSWAPAHACLTEVSTWVCPRQGKYNLWKSELKAGWLHRLVTHVPSKPGGPKYEKNGKYFNTLLFLKRCLSVQGGYSSAGMIRWL